MRNQSFTCPPYFYVWELEAPEDKGTKRKRREWKKREKESQTAAKSRTQNVRLAKAYAYDQVVKNIENRKIGIYLKLYKHSRNTVLEIQEKYLILIKNK